MDDLVAMLWPTAVVAVVDRDGATLSSSAAFERLGGPGARLADMISAPQRAAVEALVAGAGETWSSISAGLAPDPSGVPHDYVLWARRSGGQVTVVAEPNFEQLELLGSHLLELNADLVQARRDLARAADAERRVAVEIQEGLLPENPEAEGFDVAARYVPAGEGFLVGGDFYDVMALDGGACGLLLGDVRGKGPAAAASTALARFTARATARFESEPHVVLGAMHDAVRSQSVGRRRHCSAVYARVARGDGSANVTLASAGHPLPLVVRANGEVEPAGAPGTLVGISPWFEVEERDVALAPGDSLLLYTDGVTEAGARRDLYGDERLSELAAAHAGAGAAQLVAAVESAVSEFAGGRLRDDVAVLALRLPG